MNDYLVRTKFVSVRTGTTCFIDIPLKATDSATAKAAAIDFIMNDVDHPRKMSDIKAKVMIKTLPRKEWL